MTPLFRGTVYYIRAKKVPAIQDESHIPDNTSPFQVFRRYWQILPVLMT
jgi:hypothetical protein